MIPLPMSGILVLDLTQIYNGPYATFLMAMAGAEVIKIEPPQGDILRVRDPEGIGGLPFAMLNRNKKSLRLDLKSASGKEIFTKLVRDADVVVENFSPGVMDRLGLGYETLKRENEDIILASSSGYGKSGPYRDYPAMDLTVQAMSGVMSVTGFPEMPPTKTGAAICDFGAGIHLYAAIATALLARERYGRGASIDVAMYDATYPTLASGLGAMFESGKRRPKRTGNRHSGLSLCPYNVYEAKDGHIAIICNNDKHWRNLLDAMGRADLLDSGRFATNADRVEHMEEIDAMISDWARTLPKDEIVSKLVDMHVPSAPVREPEELLHDKQLRHRGMLFDVNDYGREGLVLCNSPINIEGVPQPAYERFPTCGEHSTEILARLGYSEGDIEKLKGESVI